MSSPTSSSWEALKRLARFLKGWRFEWQEPAAGFTMYTDSDDAGCTVSRKSTSCGTLMLGAHLIKFYSSTQHVISLSSGESEFYAGIKAGSVLLGAISMAADLGWTLSGYLTLDASAAKSLQQRVQSKDIVLKKVGTAVNPADAGTKHLDEDLMRCMSLEYSEAEHRLALKA